MSEIAGLHLRDAFEALALITRLPVRGRATSGRELGSAAIFFPLIGILVGLSLAVVGGQLFKADLGLGAAFGAVVVWEALGTPLRLHDLTGGGRLALLVAASALLTAKVLLLDRCDELVLPALLFAPLLGRWSLVVLVVGARSAERTGQKFSPAVTFREFGIASLIAFVSVFSLGQFVGLVLIVAAAATTLALRVAYHQGPGGVTWPTVVVGMHVVECAVLAAVSTLAQLR